MGFIGKILKFWVLLVLIGLTLYIGVNNRGSISLRLPPWIEHIPVPISLAFMFAFGLGALVATLVISYDTFKRGLENRRLHKKVQELEHRQPGLNRTSDGAYPAQTSSETTKPTADARTRPLTTDAATASTGREPHL